MKIVIIFLFMLNCSKSIRGLVCRDKIGNKCRKYIEKEKEFSEKLTKIPLELIVKIIKNI